MEIRSRAPSASGAQADLSSQPVGDRALRPWLPLPSASGTPLVFGPPGEIFVVNASLASPRFLAWLCRYFPSAGRGAPAPRGCPRPPGQHPCPSLASVPAGGRLGGLSTPQGPPPRPSQRGAGRGVGRGRGLRNVLLLGAGLSPAGAAPPARTVPAPLSRSSRVTRR